MGVRTWEEAASLDLAATAYAAGYRVGECSREAGGTGEKQELPVTFPWEKVSDDVEADAISRAYYDGQEAGFNDTMMLSPVQAMIYYDS